MLNYSKRALCLCIFAFLTLFAIQMFSTVNGQASDSEEIRRKFREVIRLLESGSAPEAGRLLDEVLQKLSQSPDRDIILELRDEAGFQWFVNAMSVKTPSGASEEDKIGIERLVKGAERFLKMAAIEEKRNKSNLGMIRRMVQKLADSRHEEQYYIMEVISAQIGQYIFTLPEIPTILGDSSNRLQIPMIILLTRMGEHSVRPLIEILDSSDGLTRQNAAAILGNIRDRRAIPALARLMEKDRESRVREIAKTALEKMIGKATPVSAKEYYLALAEKYYFNDPLYTRNSYKDYVIWKWEDGKLSNYDIPSIIFNEVLAEEALFDGLDLDENYDAAWSLLLNVYMAQLNEVKSSLQVALDLASKEKLSEEQRPQLDVLRNAARSLQMANVVTSLRGKVQLYRALKRALNDKRSEVAITCIEMIRDLKVDGSLLPRGGSAPVSSPTSDENTRRVVKTTTPSSFSSSSEGSPLIEALTYEDKRVRYAAGEALALLNPAQDFSGSEKVVEVLAQAVSETAPRTVLVIAEDPQVKNAFKSQLTALNYEPFVVNSGKEGVLRALAIPTWDLILVSDYLSDLRGYEIIDRLKSDYRTKHIPIFILAKQVVKAKTEVNYQGRADRVISIEITENYLRDSLSSVFDTEEYKADVKGRTVQAAKKAAEALASIPVRNTKLKPQNALKALIGTLSQQPDEVRIPAMYALANLQDPSALPELLNVFKNKNNSEKSRVASCYAIGEVLKTMPEISQEAYLTLKASLQETSYNVNLAAAQAFGKVPMTPKRYTELFNLRTEGETGTYLYRHVVRLKSK